VIFLLHPFLNVAAPLTQQVDDGGMTQQVRSWIPMATARSEDHKSIHHSYGVFSPMSAHSKVTITSVNSRIAKHLELHSQPQHAAELRQLISSASSAKPAVLWLMLCPLADLLLEDYLSGPIVS
jgi:hypothetical protein